MIIYKFKLIARLLKPAVCNLTYYSFPYLFHALSLRGAKGLCIGCDVAISSYLNPLRDCALSLAMTSRKRAGGHGELVEPSWARTLHHLLTLLWMTPLRYTLPFYLSREILKQVQDDMPSWQFQKPMAFILPTPL
jgi:hypothetical protein